MRLIILFVLTLFSIFNSAFAASTEKTLQMLNGLHNREVCFKAIKNDQVQVSFTSDREIEFGIHWHSGGIYNTKTHELIPTTTAQKSSYNIVIPSDNQYCLDFYRLKTDDLSISFDIKLVYSISHPMDH
tara:strand:- start:118 stop:504 length:387 start_codon:yes stop_codon:yes gene_type:complete